MISTEQNDQIVSSEPYPQKQKLNTKKGNFNNFISNGEKPTYSLFNNLKESHSNYQIPDLDGWKHKHKYHVELNNSKGKKQKKKKKNRKIKKRIEIGISSKMLKNEKYKPEFEYNVNDSWIASYDCEEVKTHKDSDKDTSDFLNQTSNSSHQPKFQKSEKIFELKKIEKNPLKQKKVTPRKKI